MTKTEILNEMRHLVKLVPDITEEALVANAIEWAERDESRCPPLRHLRLWAAQVLKETAR